MGAWGSHNRCGGATVEHHQVRHKIFDFLSPSSYPFVSSGALRDSAITRRDCISRYTEPYVVEGVDNPRGKFLRSSSLLLFPPRIELFGWKGMVYSVVYGLFYGVDVTSYVLYQRFCCFSLLSVV